jgi:UDP-glucose 4-epimerase
VIALFLRLAIAGKPLLVYGDGTQTRDFVHTADLCRAITAAAERDVGGEVFQIASGIETGVNALVEKIGALVERDLGSRVVIVNESSRQGEIYRSYCDISKARERLGFEPRVMLDEGLEETWAWFRESL